MRLLLLAALLCAASCYQPRFTSGQYKCDRPDDVCPTGFICAGGRCLDPSEAAFDQGAGPPADVSGALPADMTASGRTDGPAPPDLAGDLAPPAHCTPLGTEGRRSILACRATFASGNAPTSCPAGHRVCNRDDDNLIGHAAMGSACAHAGGFYAAQIMAAIKANGDVQCESQSILNGWVLVGCGSEVSAADGTTVATKAVSNDCKKAKVVLPCADNVKGWVCTTGLGDAAHSNVGRGGLLCCTRPM